jgi:hypothetical protein
MAAGKSRHIYLGVYEENNVVSKVVAVLRKKHPDNSLDGSCLTQLHLRIDGVNPMRTCALNFEGSKTQDGVAAFLQLVELFCIRFATDMKLCRFVDRDYDMHEIYGMTSHLDDQAFNIYVGNIILIPAERRTDFHNSLLLIEGRLKTMRSDAKPKDEDIITLKNAHRWIQFEDQFLPTIWNMPIEIDDESLLEEAKIQSPVLGDYMKNKCLHGNITLLMLGLQGAGKSELARLIAFLLSLMYLKENAQVLRRSTLDILRKSQDKITMGTWLVIDELDLQSSQFVHLDANMLKALFSVSENNNLRARNDDIRIPCFVGKVATSNAEDWHSWSERLPHGNHTKAVKRRVAILEVKEKMWKNVSAQTSSATRGLQACMTLDEAKTLLASVL